MDLMEFIIVLISLLCCVMEDHCVQRHGGGTISDDVLVFGEHLRGLEL